MTSVNVSESDNPRFSNYSQNLRHLSVFLSPKEDNPKTEDNDQMDTVRIRVDCSGDTGQFSCHFETPQDDPEPSESKSSVLMRLQLVVVETGQQWKRALIRCVSFSSTLKKKLSGS